MILKKLTPRALQIEWRQPLDDGGSPVVGYIIEMSESGGPWKRVGYTSVRDTKYTISGLTEGCTYFFRVAAENAVGYSHSLQSDCVVPSRPASKYQHITLAHSSKTSLIYVNTCSPKM